jgi:two-component system OmpR family sensor kinase
MTLRARVVVGMAVIAVVLVGSSFIITRTTSDSLIEATDEQLEGALEQALAVADENLVVAACRAEAGSTLADRPSPLFVGVLTPQGRMCVSYEPNVHEDTPPPKIPVDDALRSAAAGAPFTVRSADSEVRYRALGGISPDGNAVVVALPLDDVQASIDKLAGVEVVATLTILGVLGLVAFWVIHLGVRPVKQMTATATAIAAGDLSPRVPEADPGTEAGQLGRALNRMLGRIERAFDERTRSEQQLRQFLADASHELRTPVTTIRGYAELYQTGGLGDADELDEAMRRTGQEAVRMGRLVEDMLLLARLDQGRPLQTAPVDVAEIVADAGRDAAVVDPSRAITVDASGPVMVRGDSDRLRQVVANLIGNALVHTPPGTPVEVGVTTAPAAPADPGDAGGASGADGAVGPGGGVGERAVISVVDHGPGMSDDAVAHAFERFYRADRSRSRNQGGSGLGLAIVQAIVASHGGTVGLTSTEGEGTTARVELPLLGSDAPPPPPTASTDPVSRES